MATQITPTVDSEDDAQKQTPSEQTQNQQQVEVPAPVSDDVTIPRAVLEDILSRLNRVENDQNAPIGQAVPSTSVNPYGRTTGIETLFPVDARQYFDPTDRLGKEKWLGPFGFRDNFVLGWKVTPMRYETKFGTYRQEPRFEITLFQVQRGEDMLPVISEDGSPMLVIVQRGYFFEDREEAEAAAFDLGIEAPNADVYDQVRYERFARWLKDVFYPPKRLNDVSIQAKEVVVDGQVRQIISSEAAGVKTRVVQLSDEKAEANAEKLRSDIRASQVKAGLKPSI